jgi:hypothetical protein
MKTALSYAAGIATVAASHASGRIGFALGVITTLFALIAFLASRRRAQWAAKFILRVSGPSEVRFSVAEKAKSEKPAQVEKPKSRIFAQVVQGLKSLGADKESAQFAAGQATMRLPDGDLDSTFKLAVQILSQKAA